MALLLIAKVLLLIAKVLFHALRASVVMGSGPAPAGWSVLMVLARLALVELFSLIIDAIKRGSVTQFVSSTETKPNLASRSCLSSPPAHRDNMVQVKPKGNELQLSDLDPDADGDGKVSSLEKEIYAALKAADIDGTGSIGMGELYSVIGNLVTAKRQVKNLGKVVVALLFIILLALGSIFAVCVRRKF